MGRTAWCRLSFEAGTDHPHARGENSFAELWSAFHGGPSPRTWGELFLLRRADAGRRTIPTHVGRTIPTSCLTPMISDHPHARGENRPSNSAWLKETGPSPRTWGELAIVGAKLYSVRTIPTHVGRTMCTHGAYYKAADHPHARGENQTASGAGTYSVGPSPRTWGERCQRSAQRAPQRTIPTHVGRTALRAGGRRSPADHPHARGENDHHRARR